jgi:hypothetical protein
MIHVQIVNFKMETPVTDASYDGFPSAPQWGGGGDQRFQDVNRLSNFQTE